MTKAPKRAPSEAGADQRTREAANRQALAERDAELEATEDAITDRAAPAPGSDGADGDDNEAAGDKPELPKFKDDPRIALGKTYRSREDEGEDEDADEDSADLAAASESDDGDDEPARRNEPEDDDDPIVTLKIYGQEIKLPQSEVAAIAREQIAAGLRNRAGVGAEPQQSQQDLEGATHERQSQPVADANQEPGQASRNSIDPSDLVDIVDQIQSGTPEEGASAFASYLNSHLNGSGSPEQVQETVRAVMKDHEDSVADNGIVNRALGEVQEAYPDIWNDDDHLFTVVRRTDAQLRANMVELGYKPEQLPQDPRQMARAYARVQRDPVYGKRLPATLEQITSSTAKTISEKIFGLRSNEPGPEPGRPQIARQNMREAKSGLSRQPRSASQRIDNAEPPRKSREGRRTDAVQRMVQERNALPAG